jgi:hypothetical protein
MTANVRYPSSPGFVPAIQKVNTAYTDNRHGWEKPVMTETSGKIR